MSNTPTKTKQQMFALMKAENPAWDPQHPTACGFVAGLSDEEVCNKPNLFQEESPKCCDVPYCNGCEHITPPFGSNVNVKCMTCNKFTCSDCCDQIWKGEWNGEVFYKPKITGFGMRHEVWSCPFCRSTFDRLITPCN